MISFNWVIVLPANLTADKFDKWYLGIHTEYAKVAHKIVRYSINRRVARQPAVAQGEFFCIAPEYWQDLGSMEACRDHPPGPALLGDQSVHIGVGSVTPPRTQPTEAHPV